MVDNDYKLELTGTQGDTMKESMKCAKSVAFELLKNNSNSNVDSSIYKSGIHIHCPATSIPKDGPSAGAGITLAIYSYISKKPIKYSIAITGEIDLRGQVTKIGGLEAKLRGAQRAGVTLVIIPYENKEDYDLIVSKKYININDNFSVVMVNNIYECIEYVF